MRLKMETSVHPNYDIFFHLCDLRSNLLSQECFHIFFPITLNASFLPLLRSLNVYSESLVIGDCTPDIQARLITFWLLCANLCLLPCWSKAMSWPRFTIHSRSVKGKSTFLWNSLTFSSIFSY